MSSLAIRAEFETLRSLAFGSISSTYAGIGTAFENEIRLLYIVNNTDVSTILSFDGVNDHIFLPTSGFFLFDVTANKAIGQGLFIAKGKRLYVKDTGSAASSGSVYVTVVYAAAV